MAGQISPRNRLMVAYQIEYDSTVDVARRLASRHLKIGQIDLSHHYSSASAPAPNMRSGFRAVLNSTVELYHQWSQFPTPNLAKREWGVRNGDGKAIFFSSFPIPHSPFPTPHSPLPIPHSLFQLYLNHLASSGSV